MESLLAERAANLEQENARLRERLTVLEEAQRIAHIGHWIFIANAVDPTQGSLYWSPEIYRIFDLPPDTIAEVGQFWAQVHPDDRPWVQKKADAAIFGTAPYYEVEHRILQPTGAVRWIYQRAEVFRDEKGAPQRMIGIVRDITDQQRAADLISRQQQAMQELSAPVIPLAEKIVLLPLIGTIDSHRAQQITDKLTQGVVALNASIAIIDITGVAVVDTFVAQALIRGAQAVKLLGAQVILTGIRPEVAQTIVSIGVTLSGIVTLRSIQEGLQWATSSFRMNSRRDWKADALSFENL